MSALAVLSVVIVLAIVAFVIWTFVRTPQQLEYVVLVSDAVSGKDETINRSTIPRSENQPEGIVFTYTGWLLMNDFTVGYGNRRRIFSKADCPGLYLDSTSNSLIVAVDTYGNTETILIPNIPAKKWIHFAISVNQYSVDVYINGTLRTHHTLSQLPQQNEEPVKLGGGYDGVLGRLHYYPRSLTMGEVDSLSREAPPDDLYKTPEAPQYLDMTWYIGRLNSV
jgi:hypothetical protein